MTGFDWDTLATVSQEEDYVLGSVWSVLGHGVEAVMDAANSVGLCVYVEDGMVVVTNPRRTNEAD